MRKIIIRLLMFSLYIKIFNNTFNIPRIIITSFISFIIGILGFTSTDSLLWFIPFTIINLLNIIYIPLKPIVWKDDVKLMSLQQKYHYTGIKYQILNDKKFKLAFQSYEKKFIKKYGIINNKFTILTSMISVWILLICLGIIYTIIQ